MCGSTDIGQGSDSILAYIVAEVLGIDPFDIRIVTADTDLTPVDLGLSTACVDDRQRWRYKLLKSAGAFGDGVSEKLGVPLKYLACRRRVSTWNPAVGVHLPRLWCLADRVRHDWNRCCSPAAVIGNTRLGVGPSLLPVTRLRCGSGCRSSTGIVSCRGYLDCARHRSVINQCRYGPGRRIVYMGRARSLIEERAYRGNRTWFTRFLPLE